MNIEPAVMSALLALIGSLMGTFGGIVINAKLTEYRLKELEKKVDKHNNLVERTFRLEDKAELLGERIRVANHRIEDLEEVQKKCLHKTG